MPYENSPRPGTFAERIPSKLKSSIVLRVPSVRPRRLRKSLSFHVVELKHSTLPTQARMFTQYMIPPLVFIASSTIMGTNRSTGILERSFEINSSVVELLSLKTLRDNYGGSSEIPSVCTLPGEIAVISKIQT